MIPTWFRQLYQCWFGHRVRRRAAAGESLAKTGRFFPVTRLGRTDSAEGRASLVYPSGELKDQLPERRVLARWLRSGLTETGFLMTADEQDASSFFPIPYYRLSP